MPNSKIHSLASRIKKSEELFPWHCNYESSPEEARELSRALRSQLEEILSLERSLLASDFSSDSKMQSQGGRIGKAAS